jgi:CRISPR-associated protein Cas2
LVSYDVADDARRSRLSKVLLDYGRRVQESVFWVDVEDEELVERMRGRVRRVVSEAEDSVWVVPGCKGCAGKVEAVGVAKVPEVPGCYVV